MCLRISRPVLFPLLVFFINRMPSPVLNWVTPYHTLFLNKPMFPIEPRIFGYTCFVRDVCSQVSKLDHKSLKCIFLGYSQVQKGYRCYYLSLHRYLVSVDVTFLENVPLHLRSTQVKGRKRTFLFILLPHPLSLLNPLLSLLK